MYRRCQLTRSIECVGPRILWPCSILENGRCQCWELSKGNLMTAIGLELDIWPASFSVRRQLVQYFHYANILRVYFHRFHTKTRRLDVSISRRRATYLNGSQRLARFTGIFQPSPMCHNDWSGLFFRSFRMVPNDSQRPFWFRLSYAIDIPNIDSFYVDCSPMWLMAQCNTKFIEYAELKKRTININTYLL